MRDSGRAAARWDDNRQRWLSSLAHLADSDTGLLAWWRLERAVPSMVFLIVHGLSGAVVCGALGAATFAVFGRAGFGLLFGILLGAGGSASLGLVPRERLPRRLLGRPWRLRRAVPPRPTPGLTFMLVTVLTGALVGALAVGPVYGWAYGAAAATLFTVVFGAAPWLAVPAPPREAVSPVSLLAGERAVIGRLALLGGAAGGVVGGFLGIL